MAKDWEHWKNHFIEEQARWVLERLKIIESNLNSPIERIAFVALVYLRESFAPGNITIKSQFSLGKYKADFLVEYLPEREKFVIECDGHDFHEKTKQQAAHDKARDRFFVKEGYTVLRYTGSEILNDPYQINKDICDIMIKNKTRKKEGD